MLPFEVALELTSNIVLTILHLADARQSLGLKSGILFAAPIPDKYAGTAAAIQDAADQAIRESEENGMNKHGKDVTPWLLRRVAELTQGKSIPSSESRCGMWTPSLIPTCSVDIALIENTATIGPSLVPEYTQWLT